MESLHIQLSGDVQLTPITGFVVQGHIWVHIRMISEGSCDTEDWSNDAENSALPSQE